MLYRPAADQTLDTRSSWTSIIGFSISSLHEGRVEPGVMAVKKFQNQSPFDTQYEIVANLGSGSFSTVYKCVPKNKRLAGSAYAVKEIDTAALTMPQVRSIRFEMNILSQLQKHENLVGIYGAYSKGSHLYMVVEYLAGGELLDAICTLDHYTEDHVRAVMLQVR